VKNLIRSQLQNLLCWINPVQTTSSYMVYLGRNIPPNEILDMMYVTDNDLNKFLSEQPYFDSFTIWSAEGSWRGELEDTCIIEVFDTDFDIIVKFAKHLPSLLHKRQCILKRLKLLLNLYLENNHESYFDYKSRTSTINYL
jgi:hypothetical protein